MFRFISFVLLSCLSFHGYAQDRLSQIPLSISLEKVSLKEVIKEIEAKSRIGFVYSNYPELEQEISISAENESLESILRRCFQGTSLAFKEIGGKITIYRKQAPREKDPKGGKGTTHFTLSGYVYDRSTGEALIGCSIYEKQTARGAISNEYGFFSLSLAQGNSRLVISYLGYEKKEISLELSRDQRMDVELIAGDFELEEILLEAQKVTSTDQDHSASQLNPQSIARLPSFLGEPDLQKNILSLSGVTSIAAGSSGFNVRGGRVDQNLVLVDEAPLYNSSHLLGLLSVVDNNAVKDVKFYRAGIPAKYGGRASSVLDIRLKEGNSRSFSGSAVINPFFAKINLEIPLVEDRFNLVLSARQSYASLINLFVKQEETKLIPGFRDASLKLNYRIGEKDKIYLSVYAGKDFIKAKELNNQNFIAVREAFWGNQLANLRWNHVFSNKLFSNLSLIGSNFNFEMKGINGNFSRTSNPVLTTAAVRGQEIKYDLSYYPRSNFSVYVGLGAQNNRFSRLEEQEESDFDPPDPSDNALEYYAYIDTESSIGKALQLRAGLRYSGLWNYGPNFINLYEDGLPPSINTIIGTEIIESGKTLAHFHNPEPRVSLTYRLNEEWKLQLAYDYLLQYRHLLSNTIGVAPYDVWVPASNYLPPTKAHQFTLGAIRSWKAFRMSAELYLKQMKNLPEFRRNASLLFVGKEETALLPAELQAYGLELNLEKNQGDFQAFANYSWSRSWVRTISKWDNIQVNNGRQYPSNYDRPHNASLVLSYAISSSLSSSANFMLQSGRPLTIPEGRIGSLILYGDRNAERLPPNHRLDVSLSISPKPQANQKVKSSWVISVLNVYARRNILSYFIDQELKPPDQISETFFNYRLKQLSLVPGIIPSFSYKLHF